MSMNNSGVTGPNGPTAWWQTQPDAANKLESGAPAGYTYDKVQARYVPIVGAPADALAQRDRSQGIQDRLLNATTGLTGNAAGGGYGSVGAGTGGYGSGNSGMGTGNAPPQVVTPQGSGVGTPSLSVPQWNPGTAPTAPSIQAITGASDATAAAAESANHATVQDNAAHTAQGAMRGLTDSLAARGLSGAGYEAGQIGGTLSREANTIGEGDRQYAGQMYADAQHRADVNTQAGITGRGQDIGAATASRGQDLGAYEAQVGAATSKYGIDQNANTSQRGQDLGASEANLAADTARHSTDTSAGVATRGQDVTAATAAQSLATQKQLALMNMLRGAVGGIAPGLSY